jgi:hypothetical protein
MGPIWTGTENLPPLGSDTRTIQSIVSRYTVCAIPAHLRYTSRIQAHQRVLEKANSNTNRMESLRKVKLIFSLLSYVLGVVVVSFCIGFCNLVLSSSVFRSEVHRHCH